MRAGAPMLIDVLVGGGWSGRGDGRRIAVLGRRNALGFQWERQAEKQEAIKLRSEKKGAGGQGAEAAGGPGRGAAEGHAQRHRSAGQRSAGLGDRRHSGPKVAEAGQRVVV